MIRFVLEILSLRINSDYFTFKQKYRLRGSETFLHCFTMSQFPHSVLNNGSFLFIWCENDRRDLALTWRDLITIHSWIYSFDWNNFRQGISNYQMWYQQILSILRKHKGTQEEMKFLHEIDITVTRSWEFVKIAQSHDCHSHDCFQLISFQISFIWFGAYKFVAICTPYGVILGLSFVWIRKFHSKSYAHSFNFSTKAVQINAFILMLPKNARYNTR